MKGGEKADMKEWGQWATHPAHYLLNCMKEIKKQSENWETDMKTVFRELRISVESSSSRVQ